MQAECVVGMVGADGVFDVAAASEPLRTQASDDPGAVVPSDDPNARHVAVTLVTGVRVVGCVEAIRAGDAEPFSADERALLGALAQLGGQFLARGVQTDLSTVAGPDASKPDHSPLLADVYQDTFHALDVGAMAYHLEAGADAGSLVCLAQNPAVVRLTGDPTEVIGKRLGDTHPEYVASGLPDKYVEAIQTGQRIEWEVDYADSRTASKVWKSTLLPLRNNCLAVVFEDVTDARRAQHQAEERARELENINADLKAFAHSVSHDLRAPLRAMRGFSDALMQDHGDSLDGDARDYLERIHRSAARMDSMLAGLLTLSHVSRTELVEESIRLDEVAREVMDELEATSDRRVQIQLEAGLETNGDKDLVRLLMENLLGNAWKFTAKTDDARIELTRADKPGEFCVRDNGAGFDEKYADSLFLPFSRLHTKTEYDGLGIGLATARRIVERHGGHIRGESGASAGATFTFSLGAD